jgi:hypothetical protein
MFEWDWIDWIRLQRAVKKIERSYAPLIDRATGQERESLESQMASEVWPLEEKRYLSVQKKIIREARRFLIPTPPINDRNNLDMPEYHARNVIMYKPEVLKRLRDEVRQERASRRAWLVQLAPLLIGLLGGVSGLVAVWRSAH